MGSKKRELKWTNAWSSKVLSIFDVSPLDFLNSFTSYF